MNDDNCPELKDFRKYCSEKLGVNCSKLFEAEAWLVMKRWMSPCREMNTGVYAMIDYANMNDEYDIVYVLHLSGPDCAVIDSYADCSDNTEALAVSNTIDDLIDYAGFCPDTSCCKSLSCNLYRLRPSNENLDDVFNKVKAKYVKIQTR